MFLWKNQLMIYKMISPGVINCPKKNLTLLLSDISSCAFREELINLNSIHTQTGSS